MPSLGPSSMCRVLVTPNSSVQTAMEWVAEAANQTAMLTIDVVPDEDLVSYLTDDRRRNATVFVSDTLALRRGGGGVPCVRQLLVAKGESASSNSAISRLEAWCAHVSALACALVLLAGGWASVKLDSDLQCTSHTRLSVPSCDSKDPTLLELEPFSDHLPGLDTPCSQVSTPLPHHSFSNRVLG